MVDSSLHRMQLVLQLGHPAKFAGFMLFVRFSEKMRHAVGEVVSKVIADGVIRT